jgi:hypothetical protein
LAILPLRWPGRWRQGGLADPCATVIFHATGDLTKRLVLLLQPRVRWLPPEQFVLIGEVSARLKTRSFLPTNLGGYLLSLCHFPTESSGQQRLTSGDAFCAGRHASSSID